MVTFFIIILTILLSFFSVGVMSFIAMAVPVGPWIDVTLVLLSMLLVRIVHRKAILSRISEIVGYSTASSAIGGSVATACGFSFPTLYFLKPELFATLLSNPIEFVMILALLILSAGGLGMFIAHVCAPVFLADDAMPFPIGQMTYSLMSVGSNMRKSYELMYGLITATVFSIMHMVTSIIPKKITFLKPYILGYWTVPSVVVRSDWILMLIAIGFVTGHVMVAPLTVGVLIKFLAADPIHQSFFCSVAADDFFFAFCSGIVLQSTFMSLVEFPYYMYRFFKKNGKIPLKSLDYVRINHAHFLLIVTFFIGTISFLYYLNFSLLSQIYLISFTVLCTYQIAIIGGKTGLAPIGRFATWVMVPFLLLFGLDVLQVTLVATFVEISGMVVVDTLFGRKMGKLAQLNQKTLVLYQVGGLILSAFLVGATFWLLISHFGLGATSPLIAQRCQTRALLINASNFNYVVMLIGIMCGFGLKYIRINSTLVLGGLLLPIDFSLLLIAGGALTYVIKDREALTPYWSGVFAASALCMLIKTLL